MSEETVAIGLSKPEALVLYDFLSRYSRSDKLEFEDQAERAVLMNLLCLLEKTLSEIFLADYDDIIEKAREHFHYD